MKQPMKPLLAAALCLAVLIGSLQILRPEAHAADLVDLNDESVFLKQSANTCTLYSVLMMFRRGALLNGDPNWDSFTEDNFRSAWWIEGVGIKNSLSGGGMRAVKAVPDSAAEGDPDAAGRKRLFIDLLQEHPEGLAIWFAYGRSTSHWHAVLLTDYDSATDTFYCADPSSSVPAGRIALSQSVLAEAGYVGQITGKPENTQEDILAYITSY